ncbi:MAG TPA: hypothetical protein VGV37_18235 [Aliidongia sp.]|uniref:hypothetical protein n=1 Tax=Aliidongia sp. TaxID=1914230 RepID=UPI002DDD4CC1|nr:hypothetical protein [Aliidongia sp.]HEV2676472.1 hypothetical protein [Aliidongia sp.]
MSGTGQMDLLIDHAGHPWLNGSSALRHRLGRPSPDVDMAGFVVRDLGFARLRLGQGKIRLTIRAGRLEFPTLEAVVRFLLKESWRRLVIEHSEPIPRFEIFGEVEEAVARLKDLSVPSAALARGNPYSSQELSLDRLGQSGQESLQALLHLWRARRGQLAPNQIIGLTPASLKPRITLARMRPSDGANGSRALVEHIGPEYRAFDACWALNAIGRDLEDQPDPVYGAQSARGYHEVAALGQPRLELVDAVIDVPGRPVKRSRYDRLMLPWRSRGELFVSGASILRSSFALEPDETQAARS